MAPIDVALSVVRAMSAELSRGGLRLPEMAEIAHLSPYHFIRTFRRGTGVSPAAFQAALRMAEAKRLLLQTDAPVTDVCFDLGYASLGTFVARFGADVGISPARYRRLATDFEPPGPDRLAEILAPPAGDPPAVGGTAAGATVTGTVRGAPADDPAAGGPVRTLSRGPAADSPVCLLSGDPAAGGPVRTLSGGPAAGGPVCPLWSGPAPGDPAADRPLRPLSGGPAADRPVRTLCSDPAAGCPVRPLSGGPAADRPVCPLWNDPAADRPVRPPSGDPAADRPVRPLSGGPAPGGPVFIGLFPQYLPRGMPVAGTTRMGAGRFALGPVPDGTYSVLAAACPAGGRLYPALLHGRGLLIAGAADVRVSAGRSRPVTLTLRPPQPTDPPVLVALNLLLARATARWEKRVAAGTG